MDIEQAIREHPAIGVSFVLCVLMAVSLLFAFVMQWNGFAMLEKQWEGLKEDWKRTKSWKVVLRWYFFGDFLAAKRIWADSKGVRFILPLGLGFGVAAFFFHWMLRDAAGM